MPRSLETISRARLTPARAPRSSQEQPQFVTLGDGMMARFEIGKKGEPGKVPDQTIKRCAGTFPVQADTVAARRPVTNARSQLAAPAPPRC